MAAARSTLRLKTVLFAHGGSEIKIACLMLGKYCATSSRNVTRMYSTVLVSPFSSGGCICGMPALLSGLRCPVLAECKWRVSRSNVQNAWLEAFGRAYCMFTDILSVKCAVCMA